MLQIHRVQLLGSLFTNEGGSQADVNNRRVDEVEGSIQGDVR